MPSSLKTPALSAAGLLILLIVWQIGTQLLAERMPLANMLAPVPTFQSLWDLLIHNQLTGHIIASLKRVAVGLLWALAFGVPLGLLIGQSALAEKLTGTSFQFLRMISPLSWMPVVVMLLGIGDAPIYFLLAFAAVWPILLNTATGVKAIDRQWLQLGHSLAATRREMLFKIMLPAVFGHILTGLRLASVWCGLCSCPVKCWV